MATTSWKFIKAYFDNEGKFFRFFGDNGVEITALLKCNMEQDMEMYRKQQVRFTVEFDAELIDEKTYKEEIEPKL